MKSIHWAFSGSQDSINIHGIADRICYQFTCAKNQNCYQGGLVCTTKFGVGCKNRFLVTALFCVNHNVHPVSQVVYTTLGLKSKSPTHAGTPAFLMQSAFDQHGGWTELQVTVEKHAFGAESQISEDDAISEFIPTSTLASRTFNLETVGSGLDHLLLLKSSQPLRNLSQVK